MTRIIGPRRSPRRRLTLLLAIGGALIIAGIMAVTGRAVFLTDSGTVDVQVPDKTTSQVDKTTTGGALISYFGDSDTTFGSSGTGTFTPFVRLQGSPTEQGYNTDGTTQFDTKVGTWTHSIKVSQIPQRPCPQATPTGLCFELFVDINESNTAKYVSLNTVDIWFTQNASLTGYPFTASGTTTDQYKYHDSNGILIHDVNQGSGRGDLRYDIPLSKFDIPANCNYGNPLCNTYFVLYSQWGSSNAAPDGKTYASEGGFEEWKVKVYPVPLQPTLTTSATGAAIGSSIGDSATLSGAAAGAGGTITFKAYGPEASATCAAADLVFTSSPVTVSGNGTYGPVSFTPSTAGDYYWVASYSGDPLNNTNAASTTCGDTGEKSTVTPNTPAPHSTPVVQIKDTLTVTGLTPGATGDVHVGLYTSSDCTTGQIGSDDTFAASGNVSGTLTAATSFVGATAGDYYYKISYAGDANNTGFSSCVEHVGVTITSVS